MYKCEKCEKSFSDSSNFGRHRNRKNPCKKPHTHECGRCGATFKYKSKFTKHINRKFPCKSRAELVNDCEKYKLKCQVLELKLAMQKLLDKNKSITTVNGNQTTVNNIKNQTIINQNINLLAYGCEQIKYILEMINPELICRGPVGEIYLFEQMHFNDNHPENKNIKLCDLSRDKVGVLMSKNGKQIWGYITTDELTRNHQENIYKIYQTDMVNRGKAKVSQNEIDNLIELATPSSDHREETRRGLVNIMNKHK